MTKKTDTGKAGKGSFASLVAKVVKNLGPKKRINHEEMLEAWARAAGEDAAKHSTPVALTRGQLKVHVDGSGWLYELTLRKAHIADVLSQELTQIKIKDIRFRIGICKHDKQ